MTRKGPLVLTLNGGSSSLRFAVFEIAGAPRRLQAGKIDRIGVGGSTFAVEDPHGHPLLRRRIRAANHAAAVRALFEWIDGQPALASVAAVGHRIVHGMRHSKPERVTAGLLAGLKEIIPFDPEHLPGELALIRAVARRHPGLPQVACFDTAFHRTMPAVARRLPIPRRFAAHGVERYGFHGLSYAYLMEELRRLDGRAARGRVVLAHLGNGASLAAVRGGRSIDTSMGFTPAAGLVMSTRSGDLDPGLFYFLARREGLSPAGLQTLAVHQSGLLGVSGTSSDVRDLLAREDRDPRAAQALELFCYQAKKWIGAYAAALGGLDALVFAGGIGENAPVLRQRICDGLGFLGLALDSRRNAANAAVISRRGSPVQVRVIRTDEELMIARSTADVLGLARTRILKP
jgi:acetate kinase